MSDNDNRSCSHCNGCGTTKNACCLKEKLGYVPERNFFGDREEAACCVCGGTGRGRKPEPIIMPGFGR